MVTEVTLLPVYLEPNKKITLKAKAMAFVYGLKDIGLSENQQLQAQTLVNYSKTR